MLEQTKYQFIPPNQLLSEDVLRSLSKEAVRLYCRVWNKMSYQNVQEIATTNATMCELSGVPIDNLLDAQRQLAQAGLLDVELDPRPGFVPSAQRTAYRMPVEEIV